MKANSYEFPKSSFLSLPKDCSLIMQKLLKDQTLLKLIYYNEKGCLSKPDLTSTQMKDLFDKDYISLIPKITLSHPTEAKTYLRIAFGEFAPNLTNPYYRDNVISFTIVCHYDLWDLGDYNLRPYVIAGRIDSVMDNSKLSGIGETQFLACEPYIANDNFAGVKLNYLVIHGVEDEIDPLQ